MHARVGEAASDRSAKRKLEEEAEAAAKTIKKLKERQDALVSAPDSDMSATEKHLQDERNKLLVRGFSPLDNSRALIITGPSPMFMLQHQLQATGHHQVYAQYVGWTLLVS